jgi:glycosyltransferase involved in cell wall biosynthesis
MNQAMRMSAPAASQASKLDIEGAGEEQQIKPEVELTVLMPCLNEAETIAVCIRKAREFLNRANVQGEVLIADNGSTDGSQEIAREEGACVVHVAGRGYGAALLGGIEAARGRYIVMGDADDSYDFAQLDSFLGELRKGSDLVMGNRFRGGIASGAMPPLHKYLGNPVLSFLGRLFFRIPVGDFHCGLRGFRTASIRNLRLQTTGMEFASEMVVRSALAGLKITEVSTTLQPDGRSRAPHLKTWRDGWRHLKFLLMYNPRWLFMIPGGVLIALGGLLASLLFSGPMQIIEGVTLDLNSFVFSCFLIVAGVQILTFGGLSRYYATVTGFLPNSPRAKALVRNTSTDRLVWLSVILLGSGILLFGLAMKAWAAGGFGPIADPTVPRLVISSMTLMLISVQTFFSAFLFGILDIPLKDPKSSC